MKYLLDTNAVSEPFRPRPSAEFMRRFAEHKGSCAISVVTWQELVSGAARLPKGRKRDALERYHALVRESFVMVGYGEEAASWAGVQDARFARRGMAVSCEDLQIAATAWAGGHTLVSADASFTRFDGLAVENWLHP